MKNMIAIITGASLALGAAPAFAGEWRLDARRCQDLKEDYRDARESRRDEQRDYSRADVREDRLDRRESRRDRSITICPRSAFHFVSDHDDHDRYDRRGSDRRYDRRERGPRLELDYDRRLRMHYRYDHGRRIYVRG